MRTVLFLCVMCCVLQLIACSNFSVEHRQLTAQILVSQAGWEGETLQTALFPIQVYMPKKQRVKTLTIYIEGDGLAWINRNKASLDPTPITPLALQLALADTLNHALYLARPCQFVRNNHCSQRYWTNERFSLEIIESMNTAADHLKKEFGAEQLQFIGYSGGGAIAALLAARRDDVVRFVTVAGNLDTVTWTNLHNISSLTGSLNPADRWQQLVHIPQFHFVGGKDTSVPYSVAESYRNRFPDSQKPVIKIIESADHHCCWTEQWSKLLEELNSAL